MISQLEEKNFSFLNFLNMANKLKNLWENPQLNFYKGWKNKIINRNKHNNKLIKVEQNKPKNKSKIKIQTKLINQSVRIKWVSMKNQSGVKIPTLLINNKLVGGKNFNFHNILKKGHLWFKKRLSKRQQKFQLKNQWFNQKLQ